MRIDDIKKIVNDLGFYPMRIEYSPTHDELLIQFPDRRLLLDGAAIYSADKHVRDLLEMELTALHDPKFAVRDANHVERMRRARLPQWGGSEPVSAVSTDRDAFDPGDEQS